MDKSILLQPKAEEVLRELVALKDLKDDNTDISGSWHHSTARSREDYERRKPAAWEAARRVAQTSESVQVKEPLAGLDPKDAPGFEQVWRCKIGGRCAGIPSGSDWPMRKAVQAAFIELTGYEPEFTFSGWGASLTEIERAVVENRLPSVQVKGADK